MEFLIGETLDMYYSNAETVLVNLHKTEFADALFIYLQREIGCGGYKRDFDYILCAMYDYDFLQYHIKNFIEEFILCQYCASPHTYILSDNIFCTQCRQRYCISDSYLLAYL